MKNEIAMKQTDNKRVAILCSVNHPLYTNGSKEMTTPLIPIDLSVPVRDVEGSSIDCRNSNCIFYVM